MSLLSRWPGFRVRLPGLEVDLRRGPEVRVLLNRAVKMSPGKAAAQAVHAALKAFDVPHGRVVVLHGKPAELADCQVRIHDAGATEVERGALTAGASLVPAEPLQPLAGPEVRVSPDGQTVAARWGRSSWVGMRAAGGGEVPLADVAVAGWQLLEVSS